MGHVQQEAFDKIKDYLVQPSILSPPCRNRCIRLYIVAFDVTLGSMLAQEDENGVERAIYYLSKLLNDAETRYSIVKKLCLCLYFSCTKLKHYIKLVDVCGSSRFDVIKHMLSKPILHSRIGKWALALTKYSLTCMPLKVVKGQVVADFIVNHSIVQNSLNYMELEPWKLYFDGSTHKDRTVVGETKLGYANKEKFEILEMDCLADEDWRKPIGEYLENPTISIERKVRYRDLIYVLIGNELVKKTPQGVLLKCLGESEANGQVEAANKVVIGLIQNHVGKKPRNWHKTLDQILWACRTSIKEATNDTPFRLTYGHDVVLPIEIHLQSTRIHRHREIPYESYWNMMLYELVDLDEEKLSAFELLKRQKKRVEKSYNKRVKVKLFSTGDLVWKVSLPIDRKDRAFGKWSPKWEGSFQVTQVFSNDAYEIEELVRDRKLLKVNEKYLKKHKWSEK
ncbi:uncharacterized protein LOC127104712 [Lathyrus oleraceus]|uniref:uncharacterized protein LOC127104712 n=1 Tax=Pisum sativum TaxID=3888 RepID=UPI0021D301A4|nr:uncharacterized protein LOC127104712 [Pisum sativum]